MDVGPIVSVFNALLTAGAAVSLAATAFFVMLAGFQYMSAGRQCPRCRVCQGQSLQRPDRLRHRHPLPSRRRSCRRRARRTPGNGDGAAALSLLS